jgi:hypothetical protein
MVKLAKGTAGGVVTGVDWTTTTTGALRFIPIFTGWGVWHTGGAYGPERALVNPDTGLALPNAPADEANLLKARISEWLPPAGTYSMVAVDVFNLSGSPAGVSAPKNVKIDDPATTTRETEQWRSLQTLLMPMNRWTDNWARSPSGARSDIFVAEYGSVPDPTRPTRKPTWIADACRYLSSPAAAQTLAASYFDVNEVRLTNWSWTKVGTSWTAGLATTTDSASVTKLAGMGASTRFGGTAACPA